MYSMLSLDVDIGVACSIWKCTAAPARWNAGSGEANKESTMSKPTHEQAQLHLQVYEMRREARLRQARDWYFKNYWADSMEEAMRIAGPGTEGGTNLMMVVGYWEQACAL